MRSLKTLMIRGAVGAVLAVTGLQAWALKCDVDNNGRIDRVDITLIQQAIAARAPVTGPDDPRDPDNNLVINAVDSRICVLRCKYASCATNGAPTADAGVDQTVRVGETVRLTGAASSDPDGDTLTYTWVLQTRPAGSTAALTGAATINPSFVADKPGNYTLALVVGDGQTSSGADTVTISTANSAPVANAGPDQSARVGDTVTLDGRGSNDVDGDTLSYAWRIVSRPAGSAATLDNPAAVQPRITIDAAGSYELELIVNDGTTASAADRIVVSTLNSAPVARPGNNQAVSLGATVQLNGSASSDVDGDSLTYAWSLTTRPAGSSATLSAPTSVNPSFLADRPGTYVAQLIVNDGSLSSSPASVTITTDNAAPTANAGADQTVPLAALVQLSGAASSDPEGQPLSYAWSLSSRPTGSTATLDNPTAANPRFTADKPGSYVAQLIVSDGTLASAPDTVVISTLNSRPVADAGAPQAVDTGSTVQLDGSGSRDADGDTLSYAWSFTTRPAGSAAAINPANAQRPSFVADLPGTYVAQLIVSDGTLASVPTTVTITVTTPNRPPVAVAGATPTSVNVGSPVALSAAGSSDPDGNPISYAWAIASRPVGSLASISNPTAATAGFVPDVAGAYTVQLTVSDGSLSATALAGFSAVGGNAAPQFTTVAPTVATVNAPYVYAAGATDADAGDTLSFSLVSGPAGMSVNPATGLVTWTPTVVQTGARSATLRVADNRGASSTQTFTVTVGNVSTPLLLSATLNPAIANAGQTVTLTIAVSGGNGGAITRSATLDGTPLVVNGSGVATFAAPAAGVHRVVARAEAAPVNGSAPAAQTRDLVLTITDPSDTTAPVATITSPATNSEVAKAIPVVGTASDAKLAYYQLRLRPAGATAWTELSRGLTSVTAGTLGTLDPTVLANGLYQLGLRVVDVNGRETSTQVNVEIARDLKFGQFRLSFADIKADAPGLPLLLTRTYDSLKKDEIGDFGYGWSAAAQDISVRKTIEEGASWNVQTSGFNICLQPAVAHRVTVTLPDGGVYRFQARNEVACAFAQVPPVNIIYEPLALPVGGGYAATTGRLEIINTSTLLQQGGTIFDVDTGGPWDPTDYKFTSSDGTAYVLRKGVGVLSATDAYGNTVNYGPGGYQHNATLAITLQRDGQGRVTRATDPTGKFLSYAYNGNGELASVTDRDGRTTSFFYATTTRPAGSGDSGSTLVAHLLDSIVDPRGEVIARLQFDEYGRVNGGVDPLGQTATQSFDPVTSQQRMVDRRGNATVFTLDAAGNVTKVVDALGGVTDLTYDANGNELTRKDPLGNTVTRTYDAATGKPLTETDALGRRTTTTYSAGAKDYERQNPITVTDPRGNVTTYGYGGAEKVPNALPASITEPLGRVTSIGSDLRGNMTSLNVAGVPKSFGYDARGHRTSETDALGSVTSYTFDDNGNELTRSVTRTVGGTPRTETTTWVYDGSNRVIQETDPTGAVRKATYNGAGKPDTTTDALNQVTRYSYDGNARLVKTEFPDGSTETIAYDANGNETARTDRSGRTTRKDYDALNRLVLTTLPDGSTERLEYDAAGRVTAMVNATGGRSTHEVDAAGQVTAITDASGRRTQYLYDANGNRTRATLPDGRQINYTYDALDRLTETLYADGSKLTTAYRADGRKTSETDTRGVTRTFGYDAKGRLTSVIQSGIATPTGYAYDQTGAKTSATDASGHQVRWTHDRSGRPISRTLPDGSSESFEYDGEGRLTARVTFGGQRITVTYDALGRELTRTVPATAQAPARSTSWTYDGEGRRLTQTETGSASGQGTTTYRYDAAGRLIEQAGPQGTLSWVYDGAGRVTQRTTAEGSTLYAFDGDGRLTLLTAPDGRTTGYTYDAAGRNTASVQQLDAGVELVSDRRFDAQDRAVAIAHSRRVGGTKTLLAGQSIVRGAGGAVSRIDTFDAGAGFNDTTGTFTGNPARVQTFGYDAQARLVDEKDYRGAELTAWLANASLPATKAATYAYDAVGNRSSKAVVTPAGTETTAYAYDTNDRLTSETLTTTTGSTVVTAYAWDGNGNLQSRTAPGAYTGYVFDAENRLVEVRKGASEATASVAASYGYDADGQRVRKTAGGATTQYLIDRTTVWPVLALEQRANGASTESVAFVWGYDLLLQNRGGQGTAFGSPTESLAPLEGHRATTLAAVNGGASVVERIQLDAFGAGATGAEKSRHLFGGEYHDADAGLVYLRARWYDTATGRLLSLDPLHGNLAKPATQQRYAFAAGDPVQNDDPSGMETLGGQMAAIDAQSSLATAAQASIRQSFAKFGCNLGAAIAEQAVEQGIYILIDTATGGLYVGQTAREFEKRLAEHIDEAVKSAEKLWKANAKIIAKIPIPGVGQALDKAEQLIIDILRRDGHELLNGRNQIGPNSVQRSHYEAFRRIICPKW